MLAPHQAARIGRLYAESEFDVSRLTHLRPKLVEVRRSCVHPDYRSGAVIMSLWGGLATYMMQNGYETMLGCASVGMVDGGHYSANLYASLPADALSAPEYRAFPHMPLPVEELRTGSEVSPPPLVKGYFASRCEDLRRARVGSGLRHRRLPHTVPPVGYQCAVCASLHR